MKKEAHVYILEILRLLKDRIPNSAGNHTFSIGDDNRLCLCIKIQDRFAEICFDEDYFNETPEELVDNIIKGLKKEGYNI